MNRIKQGSTWAGFGAVALALASFFPQYAEIINGVAMALGGVAAVINDKKQSAFGG